MSNNVNLLCNKNALHEGAECKETGHIPQTDSNCVRYAQNTATEHSATGYCNNWFLWVSVTEKTM